MSIAVSVVIQPSRLLAGVLALLCLSVCALAAALVAGILPELSIPVRWLLALSCCICAFFGGVRFWRGRQPWALDVSGAGQIRLRPAGKGENVAAFAENPASEDGILVRLLADSTIWPKLLVLRLQDDAGQVYSVAILPDSLQPEAFRAVSVACRWIVRHRFSE